MAKFRVEPAVARRNKTVEVSPSPTDEWVHIGRLAEIGPRKDVRLDVGREHVTAVVGKRGSGKSFTLGSLLEGLSTHERSTSVANISKDRAVLLFDVLNIFQWMAAPVDDATTGSEQVRAQARQLRAWELTAIELDVDLWAPAGYDQRIATDVRPFRIRTADMEPGDWCALLGVDAVQDPMGQLVSQVHDKVTRRGWTNGDGELEPPAANYAIQDLLACLAGDQEIAVDYGRETVRAVRQRLAAYEQTPLFGNTGTGMEELLHPGRLSIMLLSGVPDDVRLVLIFLMIRRLLFQRAEASEAAKALQLGAAEADRSRLEQIVRDAPPKTWVVVDEAQNVFPTGRRTSASEILLRFVREGRNFGLSLAFTTQQPSAIDARVMAQVDTLISHTLTVHTDVDNVLRNLKSRQPDRIQLAGRTLTLADAIRSLGVGQAFVTSVDAERGFFMDVRPRVSIHGGFET
jgi:hypothetical protein